MTVTRRAPTPGQPIFIGREAELRDLQEMFRRTQDGVGGLVLLSGEPGVGKTRTVEQFVSGLVAEVRVLWGRCWEAEGVPALWPWRQCFQALADEIGIDRIGRAAGPLLPLLAQLLPGLEVGTDRGDAGGLEPNEDRFRIFEAASRTLIASADRPSVIILDDLHWADRASLLLLRFVVRQASDAPILFIGTYRDAEMTSAHPLAATIAGLARDPTTRRIPLAGFSEGEVVAFLRENADAEELDPRRLFADSDGNPFFVSELVRSLHSDRGPRTRGPAIPTSIRELVLSRVAPLSSGSAEALTVASVLGRDFSMGLLANLLVLPAAQVLGALEEAERLQLIGQVAATGDYRFGHALTRATLYQEIPTARRLRLHQDAGQALERMGDLRPQRDVAEVAYHFLAAVPAGDREKAVDYCLRAGEAAMTATGYEEACVWFERGLETVDESHPRRECIRFTLLAALAAAREAAGWLATSFEAWGEAITIAYRLGWRVELADALCGYADTIAVTTGPADAHLSLVGQHFWGMCAEAAEALGNDQPALRSELLSHISRGLSACLGAGVGQSLAEESLRLARLAEDRRLEDGKPLRRAHGKALIAILRALQGPDGLAGRIPVTRAQLVLARESHDPALEMWARCASLALLLNRGDRAAVEQELGAITALAESMRRPIARTHAGRARAMWATYSGSFAAAEREALAASEEARKTQTEDSILPGQLFTLRWQQGRLGEIEGMLREITIQRPEYAIGHGMLAIVQVDLGLAAEAARTFAAFAADGFASVRRDSYWLITMAGAAEALATAAPQLAPSMYELLRPFAGRFAVEENWATVCLGSIDRCLGALALASGDLARAEEHFRAAIQLDGQLGGAPFVARSQLGLATLYVQRKEPDRALRELTAARAISESLGMASVLAACSRLEETGRLIRRGPAGLSARELDVIWLLASGRSNKEIAVELVLSTRTVEEHISNIYAKIGARGRAEATAFAVRNGIAGSPERHSDGSLRDA